MVSAQKADWTAKPIENVSTPKKGIMPVNTVQLIMKAVKDVFKNGE